MQMNQRPPSQSLYIPLSSGAPSDDSIVLDDADIEAMDGVKPLILGVLKTFKGLILRPTLLNGVIQMEFLIEDGTWAVQAAQLIVTTMKTATALEKNAAQERPARIESVTKDAGIVKLLEAVSEGARRSGSRLCLQYEEKSWEFPALDPSVFIKPKDEERHQQSGTFLVSGIERDHNTGSVSLTIGKSKLRVALPNNNYRWAWDKVRQSLDCPTYINGVLRRADRNAPWEPADDSELVIQPRFPAVA